MENKKFELKLTKQQMLLAGGCAAVVLLLLLAILFWPGNIVGSLTVEAGTTQLTANDFLKRDKGEGAEFITDMTTVDLAVPGEYPLELLYEGKTYKSKLIVEDTVAPEAEIRNVAIYAAEDLDPNDFVVSVADATAVTAALKSVPELKKEGSRLVTVVLTDAAGNTTEYEAVLTLFLDTVVPQLSGVTPLFTYIATEPDYLASVTATDDKDMALKIQVDTSRVDLNAVGTYDILYSVTDAAGNTTTAPSTVTVTDDNTPPSILGAHNISLYVGTVPDYSGGIQVRDDKDAAPKLEVLSDRVDLSTPGSYPLTYVARDMTGNETRLEVTVTVAQKPESYVDEQTIYAKADELLKKVVTDDMTAEAKVRAIYAYIRSHYTHSGTSDRTDWLQGAYTMMTQGQGDCFNYFAITKLLLERCGIPNIDVRRSDGEHFWSLVSVDGGSTYYHLDTTPRVGDGDEFCLVTDSFLDAYSDTHSKSHSRDKTLYPATPET